MKEKLAKAIHERDRKLYHGVACFLNCDWAELSAEVREAFRSDADMFLSLVKEELKGCLLTDKEISDYDFHPDHERTRVRLIAQLDKVLEALEVE